MLAPGATTERKKLTGEQQIFYITAGRGTVITSGQTSDLFRNIAVLVPADLEFSLRNTGKEPLTMYVIDEPTSPGFRPNSALLVRNENSLPITSSDGYWCHIVKTLFVTKDGLGTLESVLTVALDPMTVGQPHLVDHNDIEEVWSALTGTSLAFIGNQLRRQTPGMAYLHIPDNKTPHTNINYSENEQVTFLYFALPSARGETVGLSALARWRRLRRSGRTFHIVQKLDRRIAEVDVGMRRCPVRPYHVRHAWFLQAQLC